MMFHRLMWTNFVYYILDIRLYLSLSVNLTLHFSNFADFRQLQIPNARTKYYEILPAHTKTPHNTSHKIANRYFEFKYHFSTLQKKNRITFEQGCTCYIAASNLVPEYAFDVTEWHICSNRNNYGIAIADEHYSKELDGWFILVISSLVQNQRW